MTGADGGKVQDAGQQSQRGLYQEARTIYEELEATTGDQQLRGLMCNNLGALSAMEGDPTSARQQFERALEVDPECDPAKANLSLLNSTPEFNEKSNPNKPPTVDAVNIPERKTGSESPTKIAILSFLFNWPSTGGGIIHTVELAKFLKKAGYDVRIYHPQCLPWGIGYIQSEPPFPLEALTFTPSDWKIASIKARFREAVNDFQPDHVIITDSWNFKPHLADAMQGYSYFLRMQAQECLCPLNNLRLLPGDAGGVRQCEFNQLDFSQECFQCLCKRGNGSGILHQLERKLSAVGTPEYEKVLKRAFREAAAVLVLNPQIAELFRPHCQRVEVVTWGMDSERFPWPAQLSPQHPAAHKPQGIKRIIFAGLVEEPIKGFPVLEQVCVRLREQRQDFELVVTSELSEGLRTQEYIRFVGWQSQQELPHWYQGSDICVVPTIAQDGLSRTSVEAMASGIPVVASRIGGLPYSVNDGVTGLLCEPGNVEDWAQKLNRLLDDAALREQLGAAGRKEFESRFTWKQVVQEQYQPLLIPAESLPDATAWRTET